MRMPRCSSNEWHYNTTYGIVGLAVAAVLLVLMRHDPAQGLSFAAIIASAAGWVRNRPVVDRGGTTDAP